MTVHVPQSFDVRDPALFAAGHIPDAVNLPSSKIVRSKFERWPEGTLFVTFCAGPHCNGAARGAPFASPISADQ